MKNSVVTSAALAAAAVEAPAPAPVSPPAAPAPAAAPAPVFELSETSGSRGRYAVVYDGRRFDSASSALRAAGFSDYGKVDGRLRGALKVNSEVRFRGKIFRLADAPVVLTVAPAAG